MRQLLWACAFVGGTGFVMGLPTGSTEQPEQRRERVPFDTTRLQGSPEPPLPYRVRRAFPKLSFQYPVYLTHEPGADHFLVVEQHGRIVAFPNQADAATMEIFCEVKDHDFYALTFHPDYAKNGHVFVFSNGPNSKEKKKDRILRFTVTDGAPRRCDPASEKLVIEWEANGHNGGDLCFGADGFLYLTSGDGTSDSDGDVTGQDLRDLCSGVLRLDVDRPDAGKGYSVPRDNPFVDVKDARPELYAFGLRNPWRMSRDPATNEFWIGDVGQDLWEMIYLLKKGANYGWSVYEGSHPFYPERKLGPAPVVKPLFEHHHSEARSITGGHVYRGKRLADLVGSYIYGDYATGRVWALKQADGKVTEQRELARSRLQIVGFGLDRVGELYLVDHGGGALYDLERKPAEPARAAFPRKLSESRLFADVARHRPHPGLIPYAVNSPLWSDGAAKERFVALPGREAIEFSAEGHWKFPEGTVLVKTFALGGRRVETRLLTLVGGEWLGYSYRWNEAATDADLVAASGADRPVTLRDTAAPDGVCTQVWHYPSRAECMVCHSRAAGFVLGLSTLQMNRPCDDDSGLNQIEQLARLGALRFTAEEHAAEVERQAAALKPALPPRLVRWAEPAWTKAKPRVIEAWKADPALAATPPRALADYRRLADPADPKADVAARARSYLHANCAQCHVWAGGGNSAIDLHINTPLENMRLLGVKPLHDRFGIADALLVAPGDPARSVLLHRVAKVGPGRMPPLASTVVDERAVALLREWIAQQKPVAGAK